MTITNPRFLFPDLPPELRNEVYNYLSTPDTDSTATNTHLPLQLKNYECKHTDIQICPVHFGSTGLLALQKYQFQEAREYQSWLINNVLELKIGITFKGRVQTFVQADWDKKLVIHLRKLAKQHPWLTKVAKYDIHILWGATDGSLKSRKNKRTTGQIPSEMVKTLMGLMDEDIKRKRGEVNVCLSLGHSLAVGNMLSSTKFGLPDFFSTLPNLDGVKRLVKEVWKGSCLKTTEKAPSFPLILAAPEVQEDLGLLTVDKGLVNWVAQGKGHLVMRKTVVEGSELEVNIGDVRQAEGRGVDHVLKELLEECLGRR
ncbi:uncharacterized protein K460DRAFT_291550 [Cucurbitaria berberidis CBS 394.84]|uniref:Uncharacterized protein n=1 Tax=Cucurbitaria berberidis CBS 394.84 TaxID=1168544 RepID=A0A9P4L4J5_9PLEO|nr:uncharacterized protein K460DRAFT_291550 [Cucurbitaria berberidis CBS 394.84]KAF1841565.1 hypothetical protein K460DRAFT_291550 [Cucurbitaria berberidis CBS 394.84]